MIIEPSITAINKLSKITDDVLGFNNIKYIIEFGARYGEDTAVFAERYPDAKIFTFECNPNTLSQCRKNLAKYKNVVLTEKAVSDTNGLVSFYKIDKAKTQTTWLDGNQGASSLLLSSGKYPLENYAQEEIKVESITLSDFIRENAIPSVDILWMDIQGAELQALKGLNEAIAKIKFIHLEVEFFEIYKNQPLFSEVSKYLKKHEFKLLGFTTKGEYAGDAIFYNYKQITQKIKKNKLSLFQPDSFIDTIQKNIHITRKKLGNNFKIALKHILKISKPGALGILQLVKKIRRFDDKFMLYVPGINKRELLLWRKKVLNPLLNIDIHFKNKVRSNIAIDIIIPASIKDIQTLPLVIDHVKKNVKHPINKLYVIANNNEKIIALSKQLDVQFINEADILGYDKTNINYVFNGVDRAGWLYQQLLKLNADKIAEMENYLVLDADTIFIKPKVFFDCKKVIFDLSEERHEPYHSVYEKILLRKSHYKLSFISHYMLFNKIIVSELKSEIETLHKKNWDAAILEKVDYNSNSGFSEYELYGNYAIEKYPDHITTEYWFNNSINNTMDILSSSKHIKSVSLHSYNS